jgi:transposase-like protein
MKEFKAEAVALVEKWEKPVIHVAKDLGISDTPLYRWMQVSREAKSEGVPPFPGHGRPRDKSDYSPHWSACGRKSRRYGRRMKSSKKRRSSVRRENPVMVSRFMQANRDRYTLRKMAGLLGVSCSAYYQWVTYGVSVRRSKADAE